MNDNGAPCTCGCGEMTVVTNAAEPCVCGCECCEGTPPNPKPKALEIEELQHLRASVDARLVELGSR